MTVGAVKRKPGRYVVRVFNSTKFVEVATLAIYGEIGVLTICMAGLAVQSSMHTHQREAGAVMPLDHLCGFVPSSGRMTLLAIAAQLPLMNVKMAIKAALTRIGEHKRCMALHAPHLSVPPHQRKVSLAMIKIQGRLQPAPTFGGVTLAASKAEIPVGVLVNLRAECGSEK